MGVSKRSKRVVGPFTSEYGTFNPGDPAIAVTVCRGNVYLARVEYVGYVERDVYDYRSKSYVAEKFAQVKRPTKIGEWYDKQTGEKSDWRAGDPNLGRRYVDASRISTLQHNRLIPATATADDLIKAV